ncbi:MAG: hypothetical protein R3293_04975 [Candidatus Promineifilaceae bacterium]|nr:hypothetical protein [Candidatus Promineifilaceae bacterium]
MIEAVNLHGISIVLRTTHHRVLEQWQVLFDYELSAAPPAAAVGESIEIAVQVDPLPAPLPDREPDYRSNYPPLLVFARPDDILLVPSNLVQVSLDRMAIENPVCPGPRAIIKISPEILDNGGFEDVVTLTLAPFLRRRGFYMIHAFTAALKGQAVMFSGASGQGKTTAGLSLVGHEWHFLANDVALLHEKESVCAALSPGTVHADPTTLALLPQLAAAVEPQQQHPVHGKMSIPRTALLAERNPPLSATVTAVYFPEIGGGAGHQIIPLPRAVGLARLMESSMDQWDRPAWQIHVDFLERLSHQVTFHQLLLGQELSTLSLMIENGLK